MISNLNSSHSVCQLGIELKGIGWRDCLCVWFFVENLILGTGKGKEDSNQVIVALVSLILDLGIAQTCSNY